MTINLKYIERYSKKKLLALIKPFISQIDVISKLIYEGNLTEAKEKIKILEPLLKSDFLLTEDLVYGGTFHEELEHPLMDEICRAKFLIRTKEILSKKD